MLSQQTGGEDGDETDKFHHEWEENQFCNCILNKAIISRYFHNCVGDRWKETEEEEKEELPTRCKNLIDLQVWTCY